MEFKSIENFRILLSKFQEELQQAMLDTEYGLVQCDQFLEFWNFWRFKICRVQELVRFKIKIQEIQLKASNLAASTTQASTATSSSSSSSTFQSTANAPSTANAA